MESSWIPLSAIPQIPPPLPPLPENANRDDSATTQPNRTFWDPCAPSADASESEDEEHNPSSIADVFAEMLNVNEDMLMAAAECHADNDLDGTLEYQRILHRNLMEMANYVDSMFGVYGSHSPRTSSDAAPIAAAGTGSSSVGVGADVDVSDAAQTPNEDTATADDAVGSRDSKPPSVLLTSLVADEQLRMLKRANKLWQKARHLVREEESVSAIMNATAEKIAAIAVDARDDALQQQQQQQQGDNDDDDDDRDNDNADDDFDAEAAAAAAAVTSNDSAVPLAVPNVNATAPVAEPALPPVTRVAAQAPVGKVALPAALPIAPVLDFAAMHSQLNALRLLGLLPPDALALAGQQHPGFGMSFPPVMPRGVTIAVAGAPAGAGTAEQLLAAGANPTQRLAMLPAPSAAARGRFHRVCADCRSRHHGVHKCRVILRHTTPEWSPNDPPSVRPPSRPYARRVSKKKTTKAKAGASTSAAVT